MRAATVGKVMRLLDGYATAIRNTEAESGGLDRSYHAAAKENERKTRDLLERSICALAASPDTGDANG